MNDSSQEAQEGQYSRRVGKGGFLPCIMTETHPSQPVSLRVLPGCPLFLVWKFLLKEVAEGRGGLELK